MGSIEVNEREFYKKDAPIFYDPKGPKGHQGEHTPIENKIVKRAVACYDCSFYNKEHFDYGNFMIPDECTHKENIQYTYDYKGRHAKRAWSPERKNSTLDCEFWEKKKTIYQKIKVSLGFIK